MSFTGRDGDGGLIYFEGTGTGASGSPIVQEVELTATDQARLDNLYGSGGRTVVSANGAVTGTFGLIAAPFDDVTLSAITLGTGFTDPSGVLGTITIPVGSFVRVNFTSITVSSGTAMVYNRS